MFWCFQNNCSQATTVYMFVIVSAINVFSHISSYIFPMAPMFFWDFLSASEFNCYYYYYHQNLRSYSKDRIVGAKVNPLLHEFGFPSILRYIPK